MPPYEDVGSPFETPAIKFHLRVPVGLDKARAGWVLYNTFYKEKADKPLPPQEAIKYLLDKRSNTILVLYQDTMKTELIPKKKVNILKGQVNSIAIDRLFSIASLKKYIYY